MCALFFTNGALFANLVPRLPEIKQDLDLSNSVYGVVIATGSVGSLLAGLIAAAIIRRLGSARTAAFGTIGVAMGTMIAGWSSHIALLAAAMMLSGAADAITDVAQNAHGLRVQDLYGRSILNTFHGIWSIGAALGGMMGGAATAMRIPRSLHLTVISLAFAAVALFALHFCLPGKDPHTADTRPSSQRTRPVPVRTLLAIGALTLIAISGVTAENVASAWSAVYLEHLGAATALAASGFTALVSAQFVGRMVGDRLIDRFGHRFVVQVGTLMATVGISIPLLFPSVIGTVVGFAVVGFGTATVIPAAVYEANNLPGLQAGTGVAIISWMMRLGSLFSPPLVGIIADAGTLRLGIALVPITCALALASSGVLSAGRSARLRE